MNARKTYNVLFDNTKIYCYLGIYLLSNRIGRTTDKIKNMAGYLVTILSCDVQKI